MRVKELADLTDTTVRTIRYYHQIGLLSVPDVKIRSSSPRQAPEAIGPASGRNVDQGGGFRDYGMAHLARLLRIRWLVDSGLPLSAVRSMLEEQADDPDELVAIRTDLVIALAGVDERLEQLNSQRNQLIRLLRTTEDGGPVSPMPHAVHRFYERMMERVDDESVAAMIRAERQVVKFACYSTELPPMVLELAERLTEEQLDLIVPLFVEFRDLDREKNSLPAADLDRRVDEMAYHAVEFMRSLDLSLDEAMALLQQATFNASEYVGYATTELFPKRLQERFQQAMEAGLRQQERQPAGLEGAGS